MKRALWLLLTTLWCVVARPARADDLADIQARGELRWGADQEGGGPFVYPKEDGSGEVTGFEVELAQALAAELGVKATFTQGNWDKLPDLLRIGQVDCVLNGYEHTAERAEQMAASRPYFVYGLQLLIHQDSAIGWATLARPATPKRSVGVLNGSAAESLVRTKLGDAVEVITYDGNTDAMREVRTQKIDATVQDTPIVAFYARDFPELLAVGAPEAEGTYVIYSRRGQPRLHSAIDTALTKLYRTGEFERIYERYGLWTASQRKLAEAYKSDPPPPSVAESTDAAPSRQRAFGSVVWDHAGTLLWSAGLTVLLAVTAFPLAVLLGALVALLRHSGPRLLRPVLTAYVELLRGTPLLLQLYVIFFLLPEWGLRLPAFATAILGLGLNYSAYESEIFRAGLAAVPKGQEEAAAALGLSRMQTLRHVIAPQTLRVVLPPMANDFIALFKDTSVCSVITIVELTKRYSVLSMSTQATLELTIATAVLYLAMSLPASALAKRLERRLGRANRPLSPEEAHAAGR